MKKLNVLLLTVMMLVSIAGSASTDFDDKKKDSLAKEIQNFLENPSFRVDIEEQILVTFTLNKKDEIVVLSVESKNELVDYFVKSRLNYKKVKSKRPSGVKFFKIPVRIVQE